LTSPTASAPKQKIKPFTREEIERIIEAFRTDPHIITMLILSYFSSILAAELAKRLDFSGSTYRMIAVVFG